MLSTLAGAWKMEDLRKKVFFTLTMFIVFRLGAHVPIPGINSSILAELIGTNHVGFLMSFQQRFQKRFTIFAMGIMPYINASIIMLLIGYTGIGKIGQKRCGRPQKIIQYTRYGTVILGLIQSMGKACICPVQCFVNQDPIIFSSGILLTAGTAFLMWLVS